MQRSHYGRAHRSHRWGHGFESCCDHHKPLETKHFRGFFFMLRWLCSPFQESIHHIVTFYKTPENTNNHRSRVFSSIFDVDRMVAHLFYSIQGRQHFVLGLGSLFTHYFPKNTLSLETFRETKHPLAKMRLPALSWQLAALVSCFLPYPYIEISPDKSAIEDSSLNKENW